MKVIDYAWAQIPATWIKSQGYDGIARYISHDGSKNLSAHEVANARAVGLSIYVVFESTANRSTQGSQAGHDDAVFANQALDALGYPKTCAVAYAVDFDAAWSQVAPYFAGVDSAHLRPWAPYGSNKISDACNSPAPPWQTAAWSGGHISTRAGLYQDRFDVSGPYGAFDINEVRIADYGQWTTQPEEDDVSEPGAAVDAVMRDDGTGYVLDRWGGINPVGSLPAAVGGPYWKGQDVARKLIITDWSKPAGYVLDCRGGLHPFGGAVPVAQPAPYWP